MVHEVVPLDLWRCPVLYGCRTHYRSSQRLLDGACDPETMMPISLGIAWGWPRVVKPPSFSTIFQTSINFSEYHNL